MLLTELPNHTTVDHTIAQINYFSGLIYRMNYLMNIYRENDLSSDNKIIGTELLNTVNSVSLPRKSQKTSATNKVVHYTHTSSFATSTFRNKLSNYYSFYKKLKYL